MKGYIFPCNDETMAECIGKNLFGTNQKNCKDFSDLKPGLDKIFLYNYSQKYLYGIWEAISKVGLIDKNAWEGKYKCQVKVRLISKNLLFIPVKQVIEYIGINPRISRLSEYQTHKLLDLFSSLNNKELIEINKYREFEDIRLRYSPDFICKDGHRVRSKAERIIDDWLYDNGIKHIYEPVVSEIPEKLVPDWLIESNDGKSKCYIEYWGIEDSTEYKENMNRKLKIYLKYKLPLIEIRDENIRNIDFYLKEQLRKKGIL